MSDTRGAMTGTRRGRGKKDRGKRRCQGKPKRLSLYFAVSVFSPRFALRQFFPLPADGFRR